jgi:hypothetical protein
MNSLLLPHITRPLLRFSLPTHAIKLKGIKYFPNVRHYSRETCSEKSNFIVFCLYDYLIKYSQHGTHPIVDWAHFLHDNIDTPDPDPKKCDIVVHFIKASPDYEDVNPPQICETMFEDLTSQIASLLSQPHKFLALTCEPRLRASKTTKTIFQKIVNHIPIIDVPINFKINKILSERRYFNASEDLSLCARSDITHDLEAVVIIPRHDDGKLTDTPLPHGALLADSTAVLGNIYKNTNPTHFIAGSMELTLDLRPFFSGSYATPITTVQSMGLPDITLDTSNLETALPASVRHFILGGQILPYLPQSLLSFYSTRKSLTTVATKTPDLIDTLLHSTTLGVRSLHDLLIIVRMKIPPNNLIINLCDLKSVEINGCDMASFFRLRDKMHNMSVKYIPICLRLLCPDLIVAKQLTKSMSLFDGQHIFCGNIIEIFTRPTAFLEVTKNLNTLSTTELKIYLLPLTTGTAINESFTIISPTIRYYNIAYIYISTANEHVESILINKLTNYFVEQAKKGSINTYYIHFAPLFYTFTKRSKPLVDNLHRMTTIFKNNKKLGHITIIF